VALHDTSLDFASTVPVEVRSAHLGWTATNHLWPRPWCGVNLCAL